MNQNGLAKCWADRFGLALAPLFELDEVEVEGTHDVLLDGGFGSFALSATDEELWRVGQTAGWAWSSNLPHHVTVTEKVVAVTRWDTPEVELLSRSSVESQIDSFYRYLATDRVKSNQRVVDYIVNLFRRIRSLVVDSGIPDNRSIDVFLAFLTEIIEKDRQVESGKDRIALLNAEASAELLRKLPTNGIRSLVEEIREPINLGSLRLFPSLAVRHAGSEIFQEAHFEVLRTGSLDLFDYVGPAKAKSVRRGSAHFTTPALARCIVEQTLLEIGDLTDKAKLTVFDPACGSGSFLHEALRALRRLKFKGKIELIGRDNSSAAVSMAEFVTRHAAADWMSAGNISIDIQAADSLAEPMPRADIILMNPPFVSWQSLDEVQREQMQRVLGTSLRGRGDLSMAFVSSAIKSLAKGGALGTLIPSSLLTLQAAESWRADLLDQTDLRLLASLGDYGLFAHALVQVAAAVMRKPQDVTSHHGTTIAVITADNAEATGNVLRSLRRFDRKTIDTGEDNEWRLFQLPTSNLRSRPTWRLTTPKAEAALSRLLNSGAVRVREMFKVRQGVRTGDNKAFVLDKHSFDGLPSREKKYFKPAVMNRSIQGGRVRLLYWVFFPYDVDGIQLSTEEALLKAVPTYAERFLLPRREKLAQRRSLTRVNRNGWWSLAENRATWAFDDNPRLVSKYFGGLGGFATDIDSSFLAVQGHVWFIQEAYMPSDEEQAGAALSIEDLLCGYVGLLNSRRFISILELFSPHVAGGQFNLSPRYVGQVPIPNLGELAGDERLGRLVSELVGLGREPDVADSRWSNEADEITTELYGGDVFSRVR